MASLADLNMEDLAEELVSIAQDVRKLLIEGEVAKIHAHLTRVRESAADASGERLALLEVAEGFLRAMARSDLGRGELALRRLFAEHFDVAEGLFARLLKPGTVSEQEFADLGVEARRLVDELIELGVLQRRGKVYELRSSMRALARELLEPAALRMWRRVHEARGQIGLARLPGDRAAECLSGQLGVTQAQARSHLAAFPLQATPGSLQRFPARSGLAPNRSRTLVPWSDTPANEMAPREPGGASRSFWLSNRMKPLSVPIAVANAPGGDLDTGDAELLPTVANSLS